MSAWGGIVVVAHSLSAYAGWTVRDSDTPGTELVEVVTCDEPPAIGPRYRVVVGRFAIELGDNDFEDDDVRRLVRAVASC